MRRCRVCAIRLRVPPLRGRVPHHWFFQGSAKKDVERKDRLHIELNIDHAESLPVGPATVVSDNIGFKRKKKKKKKIY